MVGLVLNNIGKTYLAKGDYENGRTYFERALEVREKLNVPSDIGDALHNLAETSMDTGQYEQAQDRYLKALEIRRASGDTLGAALESYGLGVLFGNLGRFGAAVSAQQDALKGLRESKEQGSWSIVLRTAYGDALAQAGENDEAGKVLTEVLNTARTEKNEAGTAAALSSLGDNAFYRGDLKSAATAYSDAQQAAAKSGDAHLVVLTKVNMDKLAVAQGKYAAAAKDLQLLREQADSLGLKYLSMQCFVLRGEALIGSKDYASAEKELKTGALRSGKFGMRVLQAQSQFQWGRALDLSGKRTEAAIRYDEARGVAAELVKDAPNGAVIKRMDLAPIFAGEKPVATNSPAQH